jgi:hypothetical protein
VAEALKITGRKMNIGVAEEQPVFAAQAGSVLPCLGDVSQAANDAGVLGANFCNQVGGKIVAGVHNNQIDLGWQRLEKEGDITGFVLGRYNESVLFQIHVFSLLLILTRVD